MEIVTQIVIAILAVCIGVAIDLKIRKKRRHQMLIMHQDAILPYCRNHNEWIWCDNRLPTAEEAKYELEILVAELDHGEDPSDPNAHWCIGDDRATYVGYGQGYAGSDWFTDNDWDEGQPWAVVAWRPIRKLPDVDQVKCRDIKWLNVNKDKTHHDA